MANPNIFQQYLQPPRSMADYSAELDKTEANQLTLQGQRQGMADANALRRATQSFGNDTAANLNALQRAGLYKEAAAYQKQNLEAKKTEADIGLATAHAKDFGQKTEAGNFELTVKKADKALTDIASLQDPASAHASIDAHLKAGDIDPAKAQMLHQGIPQDPAQFAAWQVQMLRGIMSAKDRMYMEAENARNAATNATSVSNNALTNQTSASNNAATNATSRANNASTNSTSRSNNAATIAKDYKVAGIDPQTGNFVGAGDGSGGGMAGLIDAIGTGKVAQNTALARMPPAMKAQVLAQVAQKYPDYDPTDMAQRQRAAVAFGTGKEGNAVRSFNVSLAHLDTLSNLSDALDNGNVQLINKAANIYKQQTGSPAPTNFEAAKKIVTDEIVKAIVGSGGGVHDREAAAETIAKASSPAQLKGVIGTYKELMRGQLGGLERQYKATTGRDDFAAKFLSPEARQQDAGLNSDLHSQADAILKKK